MKQFFKSVFGVISAHKVATILITLALLVCCVGLPLLGTMYLNRFSKGSIPTDEDLAKAVKYDRVCIIGVDGAGGYFGKMDTPEFDRVFANGSVTYTGLAQFPTISAQNWTSMLHGVRCQKHKITNDISGEQAYTDDRYPSIFKAYAAAHPEAQFLSGCTWANINIGIIENMDAITKINVGDHFSGDDPDGSAKDQMTVDLTIAKLDEMDPVITFIHLDQVDHIGHDVGYAKPEFVAACQKADKLIGQVYDAYAAKGWADSTLFIVVSDHGHVARGGHGGNTVNERNVMVAVAGAKGNIVKGTPGKVVTQDIASIVMYALGEKQPDSWESKVPYGMFTTLE